MWELALKAITEAAKQAIPYKTHLTFKNSISPSHKTKTVSLSYKNICHLHMTNPNPILLQQSRTLLQELKDCWREDIDVYYTKLAHKAELNFKHDPQVFFQIISRFRGNYSTPTTFLKHNGKIHSGPVDILEVFRGVWKGVHHPNPIEPHAEEHIEDINWWYEENLVRINPHEFIKFSQLETNSNLTAPIDTNDLEYAIDTHWQRDDKTITQSVSQTATLYLQCHPR